MTAIAVVLSFITIGLDHVLFQERRVQAWWLFEGGAEGARGVLSAIAGTMMTVATTAFSFTLVALQLSSSQYSPRIVRNFTGDRINQLVIGAFIGTFVYSLLVLRVVRSEAVDVDTFVPAISVSVSVLLAMISIGSLIFFFHHATRTIQSSVIITRTSEQAHAVIDVLISRDENAAWRRSQGLIERPRNLSVVGVVRGTQSGYVHNIDHSRICDLAVQHNIFVEMQTRAGDFLLQDDPRLIVWGYPQKTEDDDHADNGSGSENSAGDENGDMLDRLQQAVDVGLERTLERDSLYGLQQVVDIALRALSPGVNDPTTAMVTIDRIGEHLVAAERVACRESALLDDDGMLRIIQPEVTWEEYVRTALLQLRHYAAGDVVVAIHVLRTIGRVMPHITGDRRKPLADVAQDMAETSLKATELESDRQLIREAREAALRQAVLT